MLSYFPGYVDLTRADYVRGFRAVEVDEATRVAKCMRSFIWSPCTWRGGVRAKKNFIGARWCALDFDSGEMTLQEALSTWADSIHVIGTTKSHGREKNGTTCDRFRVVLKFAEPITDLRAYNYNMHLIMERYPCDKACKDGGRFFFPCGEIVSVVDGDGFYEQDVSKDIPDYFGRCNKDKYVAMGEAGVIPRWLIAKLEQPPEPHRTNITVYGIAKDLAKLGKDCDEIASFITRAGHIDLSKDDYMQAVTNGHRAGKGEMNDQGEIK